MFRGTGLKIATDFLLFKLLPKLGALWYVFILKVKSKSTDVDGKNNWMPLLRTVKQMIYEDVCTDC